VTLFYAPHKYSYLLTYLLTSAECDLLIDLMAIVTVHLTVQLIKNFYNVTYTNRTGNIDDYMLTFLWSLTTAIYLPGGMIGAFSAGYLADRIGR